MIDDYFTLQDVVAVFLDVGDSLLVLHGAAVGQAVLCDVDIRVAVGLPDVVQGLPKSVAF